MRLFIVILFVFVTTLGNAKTGHSVIVDTTQSDFVCFYNANVDTHNAILQETSSYTANICMRLLQNRTKTVSNVSIRQVLLSTHKPAVSKLIHHSATRLIALPKEYHVFHLRRIRL